MSRVFRALLGVLLLGSCGSQNFESPRNLDDACAIVQERPKYFRAMQSAERRWGVPVYVQMATIHQESKFVGNAQTPHKFALGIIPMGRQSTAYGYSQALDSTWKDYQKTAGKQRARRDDIYDATDFMGWYMDKSEKMIGIPKWDAASNYLAYHEGRTGYLKGSQNAKPWLLAVAQKVADRSALYQLQLGSCRRG